MFLTLAELALVLLRAVILSCAGSVAALAFAVSRQALPLAGVVEAAGAGALVIGAAALTGWAVAVASLPLVLRGGLHEQLKDRDGPAVLVRWSVDVLGRAIRRRIKP